MLASSTRPFFLLNDEKYVPLCIPEAAITLQVNMRTFASSGIMFAFIVHTYGFRLHDLEAS